MSANWREPRPSKRNVTTGSFVVESKPVSMHLATLELETALGVLLERLPNLRRDPAAPAPVITGGSFRTALALPVVF